MKFLLKNFAENVARLFPNDSSLLTNLKNVKMNTILTTHIARIHTSFLINIELMLNRPFTKFYNSGDVNVIAAELGLIKTRPTSRNKGT